MNPNFIEFFLLRQIDDSGVSGTGIVARGVQLLDGQCVLQWTSKYRSIALYPNMTELLKIHGHDGHTKLMIGNPSFGSTREFKLGDLE